MEPQKELNKAINKGSQAVNSGYKAAERTAEDVKDSFNANAENMKDSFMSTADQLRSRAKELSSDAMHRLEDAQAATTDLVKKYPLGAIAASVGVGLLAGWAIGAATRPSRH